MRQDGRPVSLLRIVYVRLVTGRASCGSLSSVVLRMPAEQKDESKVFIGRQTIGPQFPGQFVVLAGDR